MWKNAATIGSIPSRTARPGPFQGLGFDLESVAARAARVLKRVARPLRQNPDSRPSGAPPLWGVALQLTLSRFTRAG